MLQYSFTYIVEIVYRVTCRTTFDLSPSADTATDDFNFLFSCCNLSKRSFTEGGIISRTPESGSESTKPPEPVTPPEPLSLT